jgi:hypothetical protein
MTEQEKQILIKVLCVGLPYETKVEVCIKDKNIKSIDCVKYNTIGTYIRLLDEEKFSVKPYLRPMESLTKEERIEIGKAIQKDRINPSGEIKEEGSDNLLLCTVRQSTNLLNWMNSNHIDYCGLIPMGLALPAPEGMYK